MIKIALFWISLILLKLSADAQQSLIARYHVSEPITLKTANNQTEIINLQYEGRIFNRQNKTLLYLRPMHLDEYPNGRISITYPGGISMYSFSTDSTFFPELYDTDSQRIWACVNYPGNSKLNEYLTFDFVPDQRKWQVLNQTKTINGLLCQQAQLLYKNEKGEDAVLWEIWFNPAMHFPYFFMSIRNAPGFIVEALNRQNNMHFQLKGFETGTIITDQTFWPALFTKAPFLKINKSIPKNDTKKKTRNQQRQDIMAQ